MRHRILTVSVAGVMIILTVVVGRVLPTGFIPTDDTNQIFVFTEGAQDISFAEMVKHQEAGAAIGNAGAEAADAVKDTAGDVQAGVADASAARSPSSCGRP